MWNGLHMAREDQGVVLVLQPLYFLLGMQLGSDLKAKQAAAGSSRWLAELGLGRPPSCLCCKVRDDLPGALPDIAYTCRLPMAYSLEAT